MQILKFAPILKSTIWGGDKIVEYKHLNSKQALVGESWELSGVKGNESVITGGEFDGVNISILLLTHGEEVLGKSNFERFGTEFPLLIKFIDARDDLSIQVHPDDTLATERHGTKGKTEMWYVVDKSEGARLRSGFACEVNREQYVKSVENNTITDLLKEYEVEQGELYFLPAGRIHSIGAGCFIAEIQQTSDITYRVYDFDRRDSEGNTRELHTEQAVDAIDYSYLPDYRTAYNKEKLNSRVPMVKCDYFTTSFFNLTQDIEIDYSSLDSFVCYVCVEGNVTIINEGESTTLNQGETILIPASCKGVKIETKGCKFLETYID